MTQIKEKKTTILSLICVIGGICGSLLFFYRLGERDLWGSHEARAGQDVQTVLDGGDWVVPHLFDGQPELQKPPLYYWTAAAAGWLRGGTVDATVVRLPAALAGLATVVAIFCFLAARGRPWAGIFAATALATAQHFTWIARTGRIDVPLTLTVAGSILCLWNGRSPLVGKWRAIAWNLTGYLFISAGVLLKGPLGLVLLLAVLTIDAFIDRLARAPSSRHPVIPPSLSWGLPLVLIVAGPWFVAAHWRTHGEFTRVFFWYHHVQRATGGAAALASHPWWFYGPRFAFDFLPWSLLLPLAGWLTLRGADGRGDREARLGLVWLVTVVVLLSASRFKRADYLLPAFPGAALWLGCVGERALGPLRSPVRNRRLAGGVAGVWVTALVGWGAVLHTVVPRLDAEHEKRTFAAAVRSVAPPPEQILLFRVEDHLISYHLGRPLNTFLEWENLDVWAGRPGRHHILMPAECASAWPEYISSGELQEVLRFADPTDRQRPRDLVLMRTRPYAAGEPTGRTDVHADRPASDQQRADQRPAAGIQSGGGSGADR
jgi:4-amino-4-deoxy-L-arabinose transferase-like glycosyltransferase